MFYLDSGEMDRRDNTGEKIGTFNVYDLAIRASYVKIFTDRLKVGFTFKYFREDIDELRIEGHTSSKWQKAISIDEAYINNMGLSQDRSKNVLIYILGLDLGQNKKWAKEKIIANGMSFSKLLMGKNGTEDAIRSQRTEFRVKVDSTYIIEKLRKAFQEKKNET